MAGRLQAAGRKDAGAAWRRQSPATRTATVMGYFQQWMKLQPSEEKIQDDANMHYYKSAL
ncbi:hypothetical protein BS78_06G038800 [Paspalum vaginatum]|nr:hypothetical protein BS78_06G038800 [Paspalum vaginatum]